jgi:hypothetical protein
MEEMAEEAEQYKQDEPQTDVVITTGKVRNKLADRVWAKILYSLTLVRF